MHPQIAHQGYFISSNQSFKYQAKRIITALNTYNRIVFNTESELFCLNNNDFGKKITIKMQADSVVRYVVNRDNQIAILYHNGNLEIRQLDSLASVKCLFPSFDAKPVNMYPQLYWEQDDIFVLSQNKLQIVLPARNQRQTNVITIQPNKTPHSIAQSRLIDKQLILVLQYPHKLVLNIAPIPITQLILQNIDDLNNHTNTIKQKNKASLNKTYTGGPENKITKILLLASPKRKYHSSTKSTGISQSVLPRQYLIMVVNDKILKVYNMISMKQIFQIEYERTQHQYMNLTTDKSKQLLMVSFLTKKHKVTKNLLYKINTSYYYKGIDYFKQEQNFFEFELQIDLKQSFMLFPPREVLVQPNRFLAIDLAYIKHQTKKNKGEVILSTLIVNPLVVKLKGFERFSAKQTEWKELREWKDIIMSYIQMKNSIEQLDFGIYENQINFKNQNKQTSDKCPHSTQNNLTNQAKLPNSVGQINPSNQIKQTKLINQSSPNFNDSVTKPSQNLSTKNTSKTFSSQINSKDFDNKTTQSELFQQPMTESQQKKQKKRPRKHKPLDPQRIARIHQINQKAGFCPSAQIQKYEKIMAQSKIFMEESRKNTLILEQHQKQLRKYEKLKNSLVDGAYRFQVQKINTKSINLNQAKQLQEQFYKFMRGYLKQQQIDIDPQTLLHIQIQDANAKGTNKCKPAKQNSPSQQPDSNLIKKYAQQLQKNIQEVNQWQRLLKNQKVDQKIRQYQALYQPSKRYRQKKYGLAASKNINSIQKIQNSFLSQNQVIDINKQKKKTDKQVLASKSSEQLNKNSNPVTVVNRVKKSLNEQKDEKNDNDLKTCSYSQQYKNQQVKTKCQENIQEDVFDSEDIKIDQMYRGIQSAFQKVFQPLQKKFDNLDDRIKRMQSIHISQLKKCQRLLQRQEKLLNNHDMTVKGYCYELMNQFDQKLQSGLKSYWTKIEQIDRKGVRSREKAINDFGCFIDQRIKERQQIFDHNKMCIQNNLTHIRKNLAQIIQDQDNSFDDEIWQRRYQKNRNESDEENEYFQNKRQKL